MTRDRIIIVGGGASGTILAAQLLRRGPPELRVAIVERRPVIGAGIAYSTDEPDHLLNTRASAMSAFPDEPDHFWQWLRASGRAEALGCDGAFCFVPRRVYRAYLADLIAPFAGPGGRLELVDGDCADIGETEGGVSVQLADGRVERADLAVLATGHSEPSARPGSRIVGAWCGPDDLGIGPHDSVVILGTGLSMVDNVATLRRMGHRGTVTALSRRGLLPQTHAPSTPMPLDAADVPFGSASAHLMRWLRRTVRRAQETQGRDWRDVVDGLRPHIQALWQSLAADTKRSFLRHGRTLWEVHRHRMAPQAASGLQAALDEGHLRVLAGRVLETEEDGEGVVLRVRERGSDETRTIRCDWLIDCTGILRDPVSGSGRLVARLIEKGHARLDPLGIGLDVAPSGAVLDAAGRASERLHAVGPVTRARFWEVTAVPDIRVQCSGLAARLLRRGEPA